MNTDNWRIKKILMKGLFQEYNLSWDLHSKVNILGGANGSGKSTLLHALTILLRGVPDEDAPEEVIVHTGAIFDSLKACFVSGGSLEVMRTVRSSKEPVDVPEIDGSVKKKVRIREEIAFKGFTSVPSDLTKLPMPKHIVYVNSSDLALGTVSRLVESPGEDNRPTKTILDLMLTQALNVRNRLFAQRISVAMQNGNDQEISSMRELFGRFDKAVKSFMGDYELLDPSSLFFSLKRKPDVQISPFCLSTGERQLLFLLLTVSNTLGEPTILLLDEADMGMHIDWKQKLIWELLCINPNMQIIAATHSPSLIEGWYDNVREMSQLLDKQPEG